jgi:hypothetical protein
VCSSDLARDESSPTVRAAIVGALRTPAALAEPARTAYYGDVRDAVGDIKKLMPLLPKELL